MATTLGDPIFYTAAMSGIVMAAVTMAYMPRYFLKQTGILKSNEFFAQAFQGLIPIVAGPLVIFLVFTQEINDNYSGVFNKKQSFMFTASLLIILEKLLQFGHYSLMRGWFGCVGIRIKNPVWNGAMAISKYATIIAFHLFMGSWLVSKRAEDYNTSNDSGAVDDTPVYEVILSGYVLTCISMFFFMHWFNSIKTDLQKIMEKIPVAGKLEIQKKLEQHRQKGVEHVSMDGKSIPLNEVSLSHFLVAQKNKDNEKQSGISGRVAYPMKIKGGISATEDMDMPIFALGNLLRDPQKFALPRENDWSFWRNFHAVDMKDIGTRKSTGSLPWLFVSPSTIAAFSILNLAWALIFFESQQDGIIFWFVVNFYPIVFSLNHGSGYWWSMYSMSFLMYFILGAIQNKIVWAVPDSNKVFGPDFYQVTWSNTSPSIITDRDDLIQNAELIASVGLAVSILAVFGYFFFLVKRVY